MKFDPLTEEQLQTQSLLPEGIYSYQVIKAQEKTSKAGNQYISLDLKVWDEEGREHTIYSNLALVKLIKHFCDVNGLEDAYQSGNICDYDCNNRSGGKVVLAIEGEKPNPLGGMYKAKNVVRDYVKDENRSSTVRAKTPDEFINDDVPF